MSKRKEAAGSKDDPHDLSVPSGSKRPRNGNPSGFRPARSREAESAATSGLASTSTNSRVTARSGFHQARSRGTESAPTTNSLSVPTTSRVMTIALGCNGRRAAKCKTRNRIEPVDQNPSTPAPSLTPLSDASPYAADIEGQDQPPDASTVDDRTKRKRNNDAQVSTFRGNYYFRRPEWLHFEV